MALLPSASGLPPRPHSKGWAVLRTGAHVAWYIYDVYPTRRAAKLVAEQMKRDGHTDGTAIARVHFGKVQQWAKKGKR